MDNKFHKFILKLSKHANTVRFLHKHIKTKQKQGHLSLKSGGHQPLINNILSSLRDLYLITFKMIQHAKQDTEQCENHLFKKPKDKHTKCSWGVPGTAAGHSIYMRDSQ